MKAFLNSFTAFGILWSTPSHSLLPSSLNQNCLSRAIQTGTRAAFNGNNCSHGQQKMKSHHTLSMLPLVTSISSVATASPTLATISYFLFTNMAYILRRSHIRDMSKRKLLQIRLSRGEDVSTRLYITNILSWQLFVTTVWPLLEPISRMFGYVSFYYFYPNAGGVGVIFEPLSAQSLSMSKRAKSQIRCDWHRFSFNVGTIGRDGYRHPPSVERNWPHVDIPKRGWKHWPWRRRN